MKSIDSKVKEETKKIENKLKKLDLDMAGVKKELAAKIQENTELSKKKEALETKFKELKDDNDSAKNEIKNCKAEHESNVSGIKKELESKLNDQIAKNKKEVSELNEKVSNLTAAN